MEYAMFVGGTVAFVWLTLSFILWVMGTGKN